MTRSRVVATLASALAVLVAGLAPTLAPAGAVGSLGSAPVLQRADGAAPGAPGRPAVWTDGAKTGFGTARGVHSKVWYTLGRGGTATEMFYPRIDTPSVRESQLVVSDGTGFTDREDRDTRHRVEVLDHRGLTYRVVNTDKDGDYRITKTFVTDPDFSTVLVDVRFVSLSGEPYDVYLLHDPGLGNDGADDRGGTRDHTLVARQDGLASTLATTPALTRTSSGYRGRSDGWTDLADDHAMDWTYTAPAPGNVVQTGRTRLTGLPGHRRLTMAVGFGPTVRASQRVAAESLDAGFGPVAGAYANGWRDYLAGLREPPDSVDRWRREWRVSAMVLAASEDKTYRGGFVAAPSRPWAWATELREFSVYHAVWSRDQYQIATGLLATGDRRAAGRALDYLWDVQQRPDGSFPQNSRLDGEPVFTSLQMDEVAFPIVLAWRLGRTGRADWRHVRLSADYLVRHGPESPQERWENLGSYSPATIAAEIAGLVCAADIARDNGHPVLASRYAQTADRFRAHVNRQTATRTGPYSADPYYLRVTVHGDGDDGTLIQVPDGGPLVDERRIVDPSFLELVRLGVKRADDPVVQNTLRVVDRKLRYGTPYGPFWQRSSYDGYGETRTGAPWGPTDEGSRTTLGRGWPLLTGERGEYRLARGQGAQRFLDAMALAADQATGFMSEQVWDDRPPGGSARQFRPGEGTLSARPLAWTHAEFLRLARSVDAGYPVETPQVVACRYDTEVCRS